MESDVNGRQPVCCCRYPAMSSALITQGAPLQSWRPLMMAMTDHARRRHDAHSHDFCHRLKRYLASLGPLTVAIDGNAVMAAERADPRLGPAVAAPGRLAGTIEEPRDLLVRH